ncbi:nicotinate (nicotinamide) nucleotide adenylyltransferase [Thermodesulfatator indicus DSM 15286]|uniref:Probable nicotinate-nucleotide adenylyltransferase n=1 Tax=Thermodesulfatator indicus (strain DSM 15286 / JCM 11887 / CIR29812) TaxID=667014 RepID=F8AB95_THEID|nr:nicotinate-nucleotide adenylyltransferase [Thermodesulfatator indicus]AEH45553.1 nicotinate (nicotinamide) nucleotide adenylyltransferase [Thermodesulfatator indicus DSM 15286]
MERVGLLGGTFDPIHLGHLRAGLEVYEKLALSKLVFIPAGTPPHKKRRPLSPFSLRYEMTKLAIKDTPYFEVSDIEGRRQGPSYSVLTLEELKTVSKYEFFFILGLDAYLEFDIWYQYQRIPELAHVVVINRGPGGQKEFFEKTRKIFPQAQEKEGIFHLPKGKSLRFLPVTRLDISSTMIREAVKTRKSIQFLVPESVREFIALHKLYLD